MKVPPTEQEHVFHALGIGAIYLGKKPAHIAGLVPLSSYHHRHHFMVLPDVNRFYVYDGLLKGRLPQQQTAIDIRYLLAGVNEEGYINSIFVYPMQMNDHMAARLSQVYGEPSVGLGAMGGQICYTGPAQKAREVAVIVFRFCYDLHAQHHFTISLKH